MRLQRLQPIEGDRRWMAEYLHSGEPTVLFGANRDELLANCADLDETGLHMFRLYCWNGDFYQQAPRS